MMDLKAKVVIPVSNAKTQFLDEAAGRRSNGDAPDAKDLRQFAGLVLTVWIAGW